MISAVMSNSVTAQLPEDVQLHVQTPLIFSAPLSKVANRPVFLKLENTQPSGSFKLRGKAILSIFLYLTKYVTLTVLLSVSNFYAGVII